MNISEVKEGTVILVDKVGGSHGFVARMKSMAFAWPATYTVGKVIEGKMTELLGKNGERFVFSWKTAAAIGCTLVIH